MINYLLYFMIAWLPMTMGLTVQSRLPIGFVLERQKLTAAHPTNGASLGFSAAAADNQTMVLGAYGDDTRGQKAGSALVFGWSSGTWQELAELFASDAQPNDNFGYSVAISGDTLVVGAFHVDSMSATHTGAAYVFVRNGPNGTTWTEQQKLTNPGGMSFDEFGSAVAIAGDTIVVGAHYWDIAGSFSDAGAAFVFKRQGTVWTLTQHLNPTLRSESHAFPSTAAQNGAGGATPDILLFDHFGEAVATDGNTIVVGAPGDSLNAPNTNAAGTLYVFVAGHGGLYTLFSKLNASDAGYPAALGSSVAVAGNTIVAGAKYDPISLSSGAAYVFEWVNGGWSEQKLTASDNPSTGYEPLFGWSVAIDDSIIAVGARDADTGAYPDAGAVYLFRRNGTLWSPMRKVAPTDLLGGDRFGSSVALRAGTLIVGAAEKEDWSLSPTVTSAGAAYVFNVFAP